MALNMFKGIKRLTIVDFSEAPDHARESFLRKANRILDDGEMLLEAKDSGETLRIYGNSSKDGNILQDIVILANDALLIVRGTLRADQIGALMNQVD